MIPELEPIMTVTVTLAPTLELGEVGAGFRRIYPIIGGHFTGPALHGEVMAGGADWNLTRHDGIAEVWARYTLRTADGVLISVTNVGLITEDDGDQFSGRTVPRFEVADERYGWLRRSLFIGTLGPATSKDAVQLEFFRVK